MKKLNTIFGIAAVLLLAGALFLSCTLDSGDYGILVVRLPGSGSARAMDIPDAYKSKLYYRVTCEGPGTVTKDFSAGQKAAISLAAGDWTVSVSVYITGSPKTSIGWSEMTPVTIEAGKTTPLEMAIGIETNHRDIISFTISNSDFHITGQPDSNFFITFTVPFNSISIDSGEPTLVAYSAVHEGFELRCQGDTAFSGFVPIYVDCSFSVTVEAVDGSSSTYIVIIEEEELQLPSYADWPGSAVWESYGLPSISQPSGTSVLSFADTPGFALGAALYGKGLTQDYFDDLVNSIDEKFGFAGELTGTAGDQEYNLSYFYEEVYHTLTIVFSLRNSLTIAVYSWSVEDDWPIDRLSYYGLEGLTQPSGTTLTHSSETMIGMSNSITVELEDADEDAFIALKTQIISRLDEPVVSQDEYKLTFQKSFIFDSVFTTITLSLSLDKSSGTIVIKALRD